MEIVFELDDIKNAAATFCASFKTNKVFAFHGEMGSGKTTFIHAICEHLGVTDTISSPTFSIINQYRSGSGETIYHMDLYRLKDEEEAINAGIEDALFSDSYCFVEWPDKAPGILPDETVHVYINSLSTNMRKLKIN